VRKNSAPNDSLADGEESMVKNQRMTGATGHLPTAKPMLLA
jgi:hypothetical protein